MYIWIFLVPVIARLFEQVGESAILTIFNYTFEAQLTLPFSWVIFYFSAIFFAVANILFQIRCPQIVKDHSGYSDFAQSNKGVQHLDGYLFQAGMNWEGLRQELAQQDFYFEEIAEVTNSGSDDNLLRKMFWVIYNRAEKIRKTSKAITFSFYIIGFFLISIVVMQNVVFVIRYLLKSIFV